MEEYQFSMIKILLANGKGGKNQRKAEECFSFFE
jgi:hypothetical protein